MNNKSFLADSGSRSIALLIDAANKAAGDGYTLRNKLLQHRGVCCSIPVSRSHALLLPRGIGAVCSSHRAMCSQALKVSQRRHSTYSWHTNAAC
jgi:hypothetical protein